MDEKMGNHQRGEGSKSTQWIYVSAQQPHWRELRWEKKARLLQTKLFRLPKGYIVSEAIFTLAYVYC